MPWHAVASGSIIKPCLTILTSSGMLNGKLRSRAGALALYLRVLCFNMPMIFTLVQFARREAHGIIHIFREARCRGVQTALKSPHYAH